MRKISFIISHEVGKSSSMNELRLQQIRGQFYEGFEKALHGLICQELCCSWGRITNLLYNIKFDSDNAEISLIGKGWA